MKLDLLQHLNIVRASGDRCCLVRYVDRDEAILVTDDLAKVPAAIRPSVEKAYREDRSVSVQSEEGAVFVQVFNPPLRLIIVGAVHIAQFLAPMAQLCGYHVTVVDPRGAFATPERFPEIALEVEWPDEALAELKLNRRTAVVALTHDPKLDDPALDQALRSDAFYIAALGSRKNHAARCERLRAEGHDDVTLKRIHGPAGLDIGAVSPPEIAVAILSQITQCLRQPHLRFTP
ncbi:predicted sulfurylase large subunit, molybdopterin cytosine dinucleotide biosynthesis [Arboricoccus pini]|uniref:Predicted sulfurylase large subunit, molybdopterin cytosine dinucleotide biosynthesis n=1 Tax=Arboricoccus pini TaxID=1963835 RepID=A0A212QTM0_9PROT|nr:XdhC family protein [Arboricoccus pini]SNB62967.1 predicted sulfurylase large subunit, molybdopterin cytosine dinucleotide biosynthesis [Arboricoccus pini]